MVARVTSSLRRAPPASISTEEEQLALLGRELGARSDEVVARHKTKFAHSPGWVEPEIEQLLERVAEVSTIAVAKWMAGEGEEVAREVGQEAWHVFGRLGAQHDAPLNDVTKGTLRWRDSTAEVLHEAAGRLGVSQSVLDRALAMVQRSLDVTLVRMCESFEAERQRVQAELDRQQAELAFLATHDPLTGLPNRTLIRDRIEQMLARSHRTRSPVAVLFIDLDKFKGVNDLLGHAAGDELLQSVATRLQPVVRESDTLGRLGGDEFVVVADDLSLVEGPELIAKRLLATLEQPFRLADHENAPLTISASIGIAVDDRATAEQLLLNADIAMYRAKAAGRNGYVLFESSMQDALKSRMVLEIDLRAAIVREELFLLYQPIFDLQSMAVTGVEALIRWNSPTRGVVRPDDFIPVMEETGLIVEVGRWVLERSCAQAAAWHRAGRGIGIAVNVSARQLDADGFVGHVEAALASAGLAPEALTIEVTETAIMRHVERTARRLEEIKELGVRIAIDDFGTGYSSLAYLRRFPVDELKIDRSFVSAASRGPEGTQLIRTLVQLGKALSLDTHAEGIEDGEQLALLQLEECDAGQGFLFARPLDAEDVEAFLEAAAGNRPCADGRQTPASL